MQRTQQSEQQLKQIINFTNNFYIEKLDQTTDIMISKNNTYLIKNMIIQKQHHQQQIQRILDTLAIHQNLSSKYLLTLLHYEVYEGYDSQQYIKAIYQYGTLSLKQQINNRISLDTPFQQDELWALFIMVIKALCHLQQNNIVYGVLGTDKIYITETAKLLDPSATATNPLLITQNRLYSPQIINDEQNIDMFKSDIYVLGLLLIQCGLLVDLSKQIEPNLNKHFQQFSQRYSDDLFRIIQSMLQIRPDDRPNLQQIKQYLVQQIDLNTTQLNQSAIPMLVDEEDIEAKLYKLQETQKQNIDILFQNNHYDGKCQYFTAQEQSEFDKAIKQYNQGRSSIQPFSLHQNNIRQQIRYINSKESTNKLGIPLIHSNSANNIMKFRQSNPHKIILTNTKNNFMKNKQNHQGFETKRNKSHHDQYCNNKGRNQDKSNISHHSHSGSSGSFKQSTKNIKNKLVTNFHDEPRKNTLYQKYNNILEEKDQNSSLLSNQTSLSTSIHRKITPTFQLNEIPYQSNRVSQQSFQPTYRHNRYQTQQNSNSKLFTDPGFLKSIQQDIARISTSKNSLAESKKKIGFMI